MSPVSRPNSHEKSVIEAELNAQMCDLKERSARCRQRVSVLPLLRVPYTWNTVFGTRAGGAFWTKFSPFKNYTKASSTASIPKHTTASSILAQHSCSEPREITHTITINIPLPMPTPNVDRNWTRKKQFAPSETHSFKFVKFDTSNVSRQTALTVEVLDRGSECEDRQCGRRSYTDHWDIFGLWIDGSREGFRDRFGK